MSELDALGEAAVDDQHLAGGADLAVEAQARTQQPGLAVGAALFFAMAGNLKLFWVLWGAWLYIGVAVSALILEAGMLAWRGRPRHG